VVSEPANLFSAHLDARILDSFGDDLVPDGGQLDAEVVGRVARDRHDGRCDVDCPAVGGQSVLVRGRLRWFDDDKSLCGAAIWGEVAELHGGQRCTLRCLDLACQPFLVAARLRPEALVRPNDLIIASVRGAETGRSAVREWSPEQAVAFRREVVADHLAAALGTRHYLTDAMAIDALVKLPLGPGTTAFLRQRGAPHLTRGPWTVSRLTTVQAHVGAPPLTRGTSVVP